MEKTLPYNATTGLAYQGRNIDTLMTSQYEAKEWATFLQWRAKGFKVIKGQHGTHCMTFGEHTKLDTKTGKAKAVGYMKGFVVFNREQVEAIDPQENNKAIALMADNLIEYHKHD